MYNVELILKLQKVLQIQTKYYDLILEKHEEILQTLRNLNDTIAAYNFNQTNNKSSGDKLNILKAKYIYKNLTDRSNAKIHNNMLRFLEDFISSMDLVFCLIISKTILGYVTSEQSQYKKKLHGIYEKDMERSNNFVENSISEKNILEQSCISSKFFSQFYKETLAKEIGNILNFEIELHAQLVKLKEEKLESNLGLINGILDTLDIKRKILVRPNYKDVHENITLLEVKPRTTSTKTLSNSKLSTVIKQISFKSISNSSTLGYKGDVISTYCQPRPKLFGGSLEEYLNITNEQIPLIIRSCIKVISLYGLHSQGIFRVSGSQVEIIHFRDSFERGKDPLAGASDATDMNSVAGVLKLYFRELQEPLFPSKYFKFFVSLKQMDSEQEMIAEMKNFFKTISNTVAVVIRYLFSFLNHLSEYASENMMDAFNLAISFGPTLMPTPEDRKQVHYQTQLNELIKFIIIHHHDVFPKDLEGPRYKKRNDEYNLR